MSKDLLQQMQYKTSVQKRRYRHGQMTELASGFTNPYILIWSSKFIPTISLADQSVSYCQTNEILGFTQNRHQKS